MKNYYNKNFKANYNTVEIIDSNVKRLLAKKLSQNETRISQSPNREGWKKTPRFNALDWQK